MMELISIEEYQEVLENNDKVVVDFYSEWCGPCQMMEMPFKVLSEETEGVVFVKVNVEKAKEIVFEENITSMPTFKFY